MGDSIARSLSIIAVLAALGCGSTAKMSQGADVPADNTNIQPDSCQSDRDCKIGHGCIGSPGICVPVAQSETYDIQITPAGSTDYLPVQFTDVTLGGGPIRFTMVSPVELRGTAAIQTDKGIGVVSGVLVAQAKSKISFITQRSETKVSRTRAADGTTFRMKLFPGIEYNFAFIPDIKGVPPYTFTDTLMSSREINILLPKQSKYHRIEGVLSRQVDSGKIGVQNAVVQSSWGSFVRGSQAITDENGYFSLLIPSQVTGVRLNIRPSGKDYFTPITIRAKTNNLKLLEIPVRDFRPTHKMTIQVVGKKPQTFIQDAQVTVVSESDPSVASGTTDSNGVVHLDVPEGDFMLVVTSPGHSPFGSARFKLQVMSDTGQPFVALLDKRPCVKGTVRSSIGSNDVPDASVILIPSSDAGAHGLSFSGVTGPNGRFSLCVDPGRYSLIVEPPQASGLARFSDTISLDQPFGTLDINLPRGVLVRGIAQGKDGKPIASARVDFFFRNLHGTQNSEDLALLYTTTLAATTLTDDQGEFSIIVPHIDPKALGTFGMPKIKKQMQ